jgi:hypothetical protein
MSAKRRIVYWWLVLNSLGALLSVGVVTAQHLSGQKRGLYWHRSVGFEIEYGSILLSCLLLLGALQVLICLWALFKIKVYKMWLLVTLGIMLGVVTGLGLPAVAVPVFHPIFGGYGLEPLLAWLTLLPTGVLFGMIAGVVQVHALRLVPGHEHRRETQRTRH